MDSLRRPPKVSEVLVDRFSSALVGVFGRLNPDRGGDMLVEFGGAVFGPVLQGEEGVMLNRGC